MLEHSGLTLHLIERRSADPVGALAALGETVLETGHCARHRARSAYRSIFDQIGVRVSVKDMNEVALTADADPKQIDGGLVIAVQMLWGKEL